MIQNIGENIRDDKLKCDVNQEATNILALLSG